ncbi:MAG: hypothetical protein B6241_02025 [Spirochaetaceae bacterium 4572_59]|nr:MAG: hypothetical protein B6241_02025 [Spirochaetaceae bacterium 4572_59]
MTFEPTLIKLLFLTVCAMVAGFIDSIAGGGGLITVPALLAVGIPPHMALGTNKLQSTFGSGTAALRYSGSGLLKKDKLGIGVLFTLIGAALGTWLIQLVPADFLNKLIPLIMLVMFFYTLFYPDLGKKEQHSRISKGLFYVLAGLALGFYDGFFGPGTGSFWTITLVTMVGLDLKSATANTKVVNFTSNIVSLTVFLLGGKVIFIAGIMMALGQICGAWIGSHLVIRKGTKFVRVFFLLVVALTIIRMLWIEFLSGLF